ncbi:fatty-acyl-CoA synthase [Saccharopolyspora gloriosae]|uniref:Fatty-acyl-CoA synthase n=1 Tax=Saccharopolyspora gloriosae TaxID=455344 RepID=A0A840NG73_9PSEU|nr:fatty acyl-AMP ligase [Saccharopolyspora gloriosae]MBB5067267.1 fatty-acyl-CoA synthase [Saccharopolyspora gloriosae]
MSRFVDGIVASALDCGGEGGRGLVTGEPRQGRRRTWAQVHDEARRIAAALRDSVRPGAAVAVLAADPGLIAPAVQGGWLAGNSVTMLHQPTPRTDLARWAQDAVRVLGVVDAELVLLGSPFEPLADLLRAHGIRYRELAELAAHPEALDRPVPTAEDAAALLQLTSGSTADPKAVRITHGNLHANTAAMVTSARLDPVHDVAVSWLPLFHDMGLVGTLVVPMTIGMEAVQVTPTDFLTAPLLWPKLISKYGGTVTAAPNFAYAVTARRMAHAEDGAFDLSGLRFALNGAEPVDTGAVRAFTEAGARFGLAETAMVCAYGMAEATLAVSFAALNRPVRVDTVSADALERRRLADPADDGEEGGTRSFALLGRALPGMEIQVVDDAGTELGERQVGRLRIRGAAVTPGYLTADGPVAAQDAEGWLDTGDDGYLIDGEVVICGRRKDVIIMGGRNIYPVDIERAAGEVDGVRAGNAAAVRLDAGSRRERFAVVLESKTAGTLDDEKALRAAVASQVARAVGARPAAVVVVAPGDLPKTPSGKLKRAATAALVPD